MAGRSKEVSDRDLLLTFATHPDPVLVASEVGEAVDMSRQGAMRRLKDLEEKGYLGSAMKAGSRVWWINPEGKQQL